MRFRPVCNYGQGGAVVVAVDLKARVPGTQSMIGGYSVVLSYTAAKMTFQGTELRYAQIWSTNINYFRDYAITNGLWLTQHYRSGGTPLRLSSADCEVSQDCNGNPLNDGYYEILRYTFQVGASATGGVNVGFYEPQPYKQTGTFTPGAEVSAVFYSDLSNNGNDSIFNIFNMIVPVELSVFNAAPRPDGSVELAWRTESETSNHGFEIQRGFGDAFETIAFVQGNGTISSASNYTFIDNDAAQYAQSRPNILYRLRQVDNDGTAAYSQTVSVKMIPSFVGLGTQYPNPVSAGAELSVPYSLAFPGTVTLGVYNSLGRKVATLNEGVSMEAGNYVAMWNGRYDNGVAASPGIYFVRYTADLGDGQVLEQTGRISVIR